MISKDKINKFTTFLLEKMFEFAGHPFDYEQLKTQEGWYDMYYWSQEKQEEFREFAVSEARKQLKWNKRKAEQEIAAWLMSFGLTTNQNKSHDTKQKS